MFVIGNKLNNKMLQERFGVTFSLESAKDGNHSIVIDGVTKAATTNHFRFGASTPVISIEDVPERLDTEELQDTPELFKTSIVTLSKVDKNIAESGKFLTGVLDDKLAHTVLSRALWQNEGLYGLYLSNFNARQFRFGSNYFLTVYPRLEERLSKRTS